MQVRDHYTLFFSRARFYQLSFHSLQVFVIFDASVEMAIKGIKESAKFRYDSSSSSARLRAHFEEGYAKRMAAHYGIGNVALLRGDLLDLPKPGCTFDHVECVAMLHHMADPGAGLRAISSVMKPDAFIRIGSYGARACCVVSASMFRSSALRSADCATF